jgi:hypothetical protein
MEMTDQETLQEQFMDDVSNMMDTLEQIDGVFTDQEKADINNLATRPIGLRDTSFNPAINHVSSAEVQQARRELQSAIVLEKYKDGFMMALRIVMLLGGV